MTFEFAGYTYVFDKTIIYKLKPGSNPDIDKSGFRLNGSDKRREGGRNILILGDSFAFGSNVEASDTIAAQLEGKLGPKFNVINMGVSGYGPDQSLVQLKELAGKLSPETVVLTLFPTNDFEDIARNKLFKTAGDRTVTRNKENILMLSMPRVNSLLKLELLTSSLINKKSRYYDLFMELFDDGYDFDLMRNINSTKSKDKLALMRYVIRSFKETVDSMGAKLIVVIIPSSRQIIEPEYFYQFEISDYNSLTNERETYNICIEEQIATIYLYPFFINTKQRAQLYDLENRHLSPLGYKQVAGLIYRVIKSED